MNHESQVSLTCSTRDAARRLGVSVRTAQLWVEDGRLRAWKTPGGHRRILVESVDRLIDEQRQAGLPVGQAYRVLLMREDDGERAGLRDLLLKMLPDCKIATAASGFEGLIRIGEVQPDVLITDLGVTGLDFFRMIHSLAGHLRDRAMEVIVLLGQGNDGSAVAARLPEGVVLVEPPVDGAELAALVWGRLRARGRTHPPLAGVPDGAEGGCLCTGVSGAAG